MFVCVYCRYILCMSACPSPFNTTINAIGLEQGGRVLPRTPRRPELRVKSFEQAALKKAASGNTGRPRVKPVPRKARFETGSCTRFAQRHACKHQRIPRNEHIGSASVPLGRGGDTPTHFGSAGRRSVPPGVVSFVISL